MTSLLLEEDINAKMKQKLMSDGAVKEETRSFLNFSRENLSILHSDLEQGFNRSRPRLDKNTILSATALTVALLCLSLISWKLFVIESCTCYSLSNVHIIEEMKRDIDILKQRFSKQDLMDKMKSLGKALPNEDSTDDSDPDEEDIDNADYDPNYDDDISATHDYSGDYHTPLIYGARPSDFTSTSTPMSTSPSPSPKNVVAELIAALRQAEVKRRREFEKNMRENHKNIERERLKEEHEEHEEKNDDAKHSTERKRESVAGNAASAEYITKSVKSKRSVSDRAMLDHSTNTPNHQHGERHHKRTKEHSYYVSGKNEAEDDPADSLPTSHHSKKYYSLPPLEEFTRDGQSRPEMNTHTNESAQRTDSNERVNWRNAQRGNTEVSVEIRRPIQNIDEAVTEFHPRLTRRHLRAPRQVYAVHYEADSTLFSSEDQHTGNGRARHYRGVFKAWRPATWVGDLGMNRHFTLATDGQLTVHEPGLYTIYAQIHYVDEHDENGFHVLVNGRPIMQCMVYSPGMEHKSRSCYSSQIAFLQAGDHVVVKDIGSERYTLFQHDKSFFGLATFGELRQQQRQN